MADADMGAVDGRVFDRSTPHPVMNGEPYCRACHPLIGPNRRMTTCSGERRG